MILSLWLLTATASATEYAALVQAQPEWIRRGGCDQPGRNEEPPAVAALKASLTARYSWAIPTAAAIEAIAAWSPLVDFGAGSGYWSALLAAEGADVVAIDNWSWGRPRLWHPVETGDEATLPAHRARTLLLVWPPRDGMAARALEAWGGEHLVYVGEMRRGSADLAFFDALDRGWRLVRRVEIPRWWNRSDAVYLIERGSSARSSWTTDELARDCALEDS